MKVSRKTAARWNADNPRWKECDCMRELDSTIGGYPSFEQAPTQYRCLFRRFAGVNNHTRRRLPQALPASSQMHFDRKAAFNFQRDTYDTLSTLI
jgi:hypothetical protein